MGGLLYSLRGITATSSGIPSYAHFNRRGDVVARTNANGQVTYQASYEAGGTRIAEFGSTLDRQKANTKEEDPSGLLNEGKRYRDLQTGTFITKDPAGFIDGPNLYCYVNQNPWTKFDPEGLAAAPYNPDDPSTWRLPAESKPGKPAVGYFLGERGNSTFVFNEPELQQQFSRGIQFKKGMPDFSPYVMSVESSGKKILGQVTIAVTGNPTKDGRAARAAFRTLGGETPAGAVWHHAGDGKMQLVPEILNSKVVHTGETAAVRLWAKGARLAGRGLGAALFFADPGEAMAGPLGTTQLGDSTVSGAARTRLQYETDPVTRLRDLGQLEFWDRRDRQNEINLLREAYPEKYAEFFDHSNK